MLTLDDDQLAALRRAVDSAAEVAALRPALDRIYTQLQSEIAKRQPRCDASGRCCRFESFGHRLFITTAELAVLRDHLPPAPAGWDATGCPQQIAGRCGVHAIRPFGCRIFFCDPSAQAWQAECYETFHQRIRELHEALSIDYFYVEWIAGLRATGLIDGPTVILQRSTPSPALPASGQQLRSAPRPPVSVRLSVI